MASKPKRPVSVWIAQILLAISVLYFFALFVFAAVWTAITWNGQAPKVLAAVYIAYPIVFLSISIASLEGFLGMIKRKRYARWLAIGVFSVALALFALVETFLALGVFVTSSGSVALPIAIRAFVFGSFLWLILHLAFSKGVTEFFNQHGWP